MSDDIREAKRKLPLPALLHQLGLGEHAKKSARCPLHEDRHNSFSIWQRDGVWFWKCHTGCGDGDEITFLERHKGISRGEAIRLFVEMAGVNGSERIREHSSAAFPLPSQRQASNGEKAFNWEQCVSDLKAKDLVKLGNGRWYSRAFCSLLHEKQLVGLFNGSVAFPVHDAAGDVVAAHYRLDDGTWRYHPTGTKTHPFVIAELISGDPIHVFESQWDAFAFMDKSGEHSGILITRGASNGAFVADLIPQGSTIHVWTQNDSAGEKWQQDICAHTKATVKRVKIPALHKDLNDWTRAGATSDDLLQAMLNAETVSEADRPLIEFRSPLQLKKFIPPPGIVLVGDCHIVKGATFVIGGAPGVGKSRASVALAVAGATCSDWFGLPIRRKLKVMIIQTENGEFRLSKEFRDLDCDALERYVLICPPPLYGLCFQRDDFCGQLAAAISEFKPDIVIFDPWNAVARDEKAREYLETFNDLRSVLPLGNDAPALGIVAHTRKPKTDERASGRALLNLLTGSYVLGSVPRSVFVMQAASDETTDNRVVWTCCKNNDGELGSRSAWERRNGLFAPVTDFDWEAFDAPDKDQREVIGEADVRAVFENGALTKGQAVKQLAANTGASQASCYRALNPDGRFGKHLCAEKGMLTWR
jgi:hypothetical protein